MKKLLVLIIHSFFVISFPSFATLNNTTNAPAYSTPSLMKDTVSIEDKLGEDYCQQITQLVATNQKEEDPISMSLIDMNHIEESGDEELTFDTMYRMLGSYNRLLRVIRYFGYRHKKIDGIYKVINCDSHQPSVGDAAQ